MSNIGYKFTTMNMPTTLKTLVYRMFPTRDSVEPQRSGVAGRLPTDGGASVAVHPADVLGRHFEVSLSLGTGELGDDIRMEEAIVSVSKSKTILTTQLVGMKGTVKECISDGDYELTITVGLVATDANGMVTDEYPSEGVKALRDLLERNEVLYVNSEFLRLFEITRLVVKKYKIEQATHGNHQIVKIEEALSDGDYIIENNKY